jgi:hypothetical protein
MSTTIPSSVPWREIALGAWQAPSWREAAIEYHKDHPASLPLTDKLATSEREIWRAAGRCVRRVKPHDGLKAFLGWCDRHGVSRGDALPIFNAIVDKELAK